MSDVCAHFLKSFFSVDHTSLHVDDFPCFLLHLGCPFFSALLYVLHLLVAVVIDTIPPLAALRACSSSCLLFLVVGYSNLALVIEVTSNFRQMVDGSLEASFEIIEVVGGREIAQGMLCCVVEIMR